MGLVARVGGATTAILHIAAQNAKLHQILIMYPIRPSLSLVLQVVGVLSAYSLGLAMEDGEDRRSACADAVDRVSVSVRGSRPIGPPPIQWSPIPRGPPPKPWLALRCSS